MVGEGLIEIRRGLRKRNKNYDYLLLITKEQEFSNFV